MSLSSLNRDGAAAPQARAREAAPTLRGKPLGPDTRGRFIGRRAKKPRQLAVVMDVCSGCAGSPVCQTCCPVEDCMLLVADPAAFPFTRIVVDPLKCVGCRKCLRDGPEASFLDGCPWDAIVMVATETWEKAHGQLEY